MSLFLRYAYSRKARHAVASQEVVRKDRRYSLTRAFSKDQGSQNMRVFVWSTRCTTRSLD